MSSPSPSFDICNHEACYRASLRRDARFDGRFYTAVTSTGIYCRPICPAPTAKRKNCLFFPSAASAQAAGFRPCIRCRPELAPGSAGWDGQDASVKRAMAFIADGGLSDERKLSDLAHHVGIGSRHLRRLFKQHVGATPIEVASAHKVALAKSLIVDSDLSITQIAFAAGFNSIRRFNHVFKATFDRPPSALRRQSAKGEAGANTIRLLLPYRPPFDWQALLAFFAERAVAGVEEVTRDEYRRTFRLGKAAGCVRLRQDRARSQIVAQIGIDDIAVLPALVGRLRHLIDADCDPEALACDLGADPWLGRSIRRRPGLRIPGAIDAFEQAVRAILGQQISVQAARTLAGRIVARWGTELEADMKPEIPRRLFPTAPALATAELESVGVLPSRAASIRALARSAITDPNLLSRFQPHTAVSDKLSAIPGVGPWTVEYISLRALGNPDAFPGSDLGLLKAARLYQPDMTARGLGAWAERWRPWRGYAAAHLWASLSDGEKEEAA
jgi:AraC family transcriptional regulator, regulatory protein of adaptative response / DNA-3-methyladenine glycosylase II